MKRNVILALFADITQRANPRINFTLMHDHTRAAADHITRDIIHIRAEGHLLAVVVLIQAQSLSHFKMTGSISDTFSIGTCNK